MEREWRRGWKKRVLGRQSDDDRTHFIGDEKTRNWRKKLTPQIALSQVTNQCLNHGKCVSSG